MEIRLCFENKSGIRIDEASVFRHYAENYLSGFDLEWAGTVSIPHYQTNTGHMEPLWQYMIRDASIACRDYLKEYLTRNPMAGYFVHLYEHNIGEPEKKFY
jgi:predicted protein tyrosine phosphatase